MAPSRSQSGWRQVGLHRSRGLSNARLQGHHAVQLLTRVARAYLPWRDDDSHTNLGWDSLRPALIARRVSQGLRPFQLGLEVADLALVCIDSTGQVEARFELHGRTIEDASGWVKRILDERGLPLEPFEQPLHFEIPPHPVAAGAPFDQRGDAEALAELARYFANGYHALHSVLAGEPRASQPRCWPHHFDVGALIELSAGRSIGLGLEPGDAFSDLPYFYVNPYPSPDPSALPALDPGGHWHTAGWIGAVATAQDIARQPDQEAWTCAFLAHAIASIKAMLGA